MGDKKRVDPVNRALTLRNTLKNELGDVLVVDFSGTDQGKDTSKILDLMSNVNTREKVFRVKANVKDIDPAGAKSYGKKFIDISKMGDKQIENLVKREEFDFPLWFKSEDFYSMRDLHHYNLPFILQVAGCNFHDGSETGGCTFCFVDNMSNDGRKGKGKTYLSVQDAVASYISARKDFKKFYKDNFNFDTDIRVIRTSGGEPTLALDWILDFWRVIEKQRLGGIQGLEGIVGQIDSNLSTGSVVKNFEEKGIYEKDILNKLSKYPIRILTALKGTDIENMQNNVQSTTTIEEQFYSIRRFLEAGFDIYPQLYNPNPKTFGKYLQTLEEKFPNISMRIHVGPLKIYGPTIKRLNAQAKILGRNEEKYRDYMKNFWDNNYKNGCEVIDAFLRERHGVGYKDVVRADVPIKIKR